MKRFVFIGASQFGRECLQQARRVQDLQLVGVLTAPRRFSISYRPEGVENVLHDDVASLVEPDGVPVEVLAQGMADDSLLARVSAWKPDFMLVAGWYHKLPRSWLELAPAAGLHASLLPDYSGGAPLVWAMIHGEVRTGVTLFWMNEATDAGPVIAQRDFPILDDDTIATLYQRATGAALEMLEVELPRIVAGCAAAIPQDESRRRVMPQRGPCDGRIDWRWPARQVYNFIRAQTRPYPGAFTVRPEGLVKIWSSRVTPRHSEDPPGTAHGDAVVCGDGVLLELTETCLESP